MKYFLRVFFAGLIGWMLAVPPVYGQCNLIHDKVDEFDSTRTVAAKPVNVGFIIPSNFDLGGASGILTKDHNQVP